MATKLKLDSNEIRQTRQVAKFFKKGIKIRYNKKLTRKVRLYVSEKNSLKSMNGILSLYEERLN